MPIETECFYADRDKEHCHGKILTQSDCGTEDIWYFGVCLHHNGRFPGDGESDTWNECEEKINDMCAEYKY